MVSPVAGGFWGELRNSASGNATGPPAGAIPPQAESQSENQNNNENRRDRDIQDDATANPRPRQRGRRSTNSDVTIRCCTCERWNFCSANGTRCECIEAGRECYNCKCFDGRCTNHPSHNITTTPPPNNTTTTRAVAGEQPIDPNPRRNPGRSGRPSLSMADPPTPADDDEQPPTQPNAPADEDGDGSQPSQNTTNGSTAATDTAPTVGAFPNLREAEAEAGNNGGEEESEQVPDDNGAAAEPNGDAADPVEEERHTENLQTITIDPESLADLANQPELPVDTKLKAVHNGETLHRNDGRHLHGGIANDTIWQGRWDLVNDIGHNLYYPPQGKVGARVVETYADLWDGVIDRKWNAEVPLCFLACILRRRQGCVKSKDIRRRVENRLDLWQEGKYDALIQSIRNEALRGVGGGRPSVEEEKVSRAFHNKILDGKLHQAVRSLTNREGGGVMMPHDHCTKATNRRVIDVLRDKHPDLYVPDLDSPDNIAFEDYDQVPDPIPLDMTVDEIETISRKLKGGAGPDSVDASMMRNLLLRHKRASFRLREVMTRWVLWLANEMPPWAAYRGVTDRRMVALDKDPGTRPVGISCVWIRGVCKAMLIETGSDGKEACGSAQLCAGLEAGIEGAVHSVRRRCLEMGVLEFEDWEVEDEIWLEEADDGELPPWEAAPEAATARADANAEAPAEAPSQNVGEDTASSASEDPYVHSLVDARNGFNMLTKFASMWTVRHLWASGARFAMNLYRHFARLIVRAEPGNRPEIILSREGVVRGCVLGMFLYGITLLPLGQHVAQAAPNTLQPWFADDFSIFAPASVCAAACIEVARVGPSVGYHPEHDKMWGICTRRDEEAVKAQFAAKGLPMKCTRGKRFVGGYVGSEEMRKRWLDEKVAAWVSGVEALSTVAGRYPQSAYYAFVNCLQAEWQYVSRCCEGIGPLLQPIEDRIRTVFIPALFGGLNAPFDDDFCRLLANGVKQGGMALRNPVDASDKLFEASSDATSLLATSLIDGSKLNNTAHKQQVKEAGRKMRKARDETEKEVVDALSAAGGVKVKKRLDRMKETGAWMQAAPDRFDGTELSKDEWHDNITIRYGMRPKGLPQRCDGCNAGFSVEHGLSCKKGGLVGIRHDDLRDEYAHLCGLALTTARVSSEPQIFYGNGTSAVRGNNTTEADLGDESRGDVYAHGLWRRGIGTVMDCRITDTDAKSYGNVAAAKILERHAREKKSKYEEACRERRRDFVPLVYSVDGMPCKAARSAERRIASLLAAKWDRQYSDMCCFVRRRIALSIAITVTDAKSYGNVAAAVAAAKILERHAREKKSKYEEACRERRRDFVPLVYSVDGMPCKAARSAERRIASLLAAKCDRQYSDMCCFVRRRIALSIARSTTLLLRGDRSTAWKRRAPEDGAAAGAGSTINN